MEVTRETPTTRWLIMAAAWAVVAAIALWHTAAMRNYVALLDSVGQPAAAHATPLSRPVPGSFADSQAWVRYALAAGETGQWRVRFSATDNAPKGREVHWNSGLIQLIALAGKLQRAATGEPLPYATENALAWFNLPLLLAAVISFSAWAAARAGAGAGVLVALGMVGLHTFYDGFAPNYVDHHGLLTAAVFGTMLGAIFMGAGWHQAAGPTAGLLPASNRAARRAAITSALCAATGMWISAASTIPAIAFVGLGGLAAVALAGRGLLRTGATFEPDLWRWWGRIGAATSLAFYGLEYAPHHLGLRLEVNHPFYACAWWGGAELVALLAVWRLGGKAARPKTKQWIFPAAALMPAPLTVLIGGAAVFMVSDPFVGDLRHTVGEGMSFRAATQAFGSQYAQQYLMHFLLLGGAVWLLIATRGNRLILLFSTLVAFAFVALACWEIRWWIVGSGTLLCLILVMAAVAGATWPTRSRWLLVLLVGAVLLPMGAVSDARVLRANVRRSSANPADLMQPLYREIAYTLRASQPQGDLVVLSNPDASNSISYYGRCRTLGTLYWENVEGLKAAAAIHCANSDAAALALIRARGVTHLAMISRGSFLTEFFKLFRPGVPAQEVEKTFGHRLLVKRQLPRWLRVIPFRLPANMAVPDLSVLLLQVVPEQSEFDASWNLAAALLAIDPSGAALTHFQHAISLAPPDRRAELYQKAGDLAFDQNADVAAVPLYRAAIDAGAGPDLLVKLVWLLSTSASPAVRNGREAITVIEPIARANPNHLMALEAFAAALAENGRFNEAADVAGRAVAIVRNSGAAQNIAPLQQRLDTYRAGRPWRR